MAAITAELTASTAVHAVWSLEVMPALSTGRKDSNTACKLSNRRETGSDDSVYGMVWYGGGFGQEFIFGEGWVKLFGAAWYCGVGL